MAQYGISGANVTSTLRYSGPINFAAAYANASPLLAYAIAYRETIHGEIIGLWNAATIVSGDGGHGLMQITTPPIPKNWADPYTNACDGIERFILPAVAFWSAAPFGYRGIALVRCVAAEFNAGRSAALAGHDQGNVGLETTNDYPSGVAAYYNALVAGTDLEAVAS